MADATTWTKRVAEWRASGMTATEFCVANGLSLSSLRYWAYKRGKAEVAEEATAERPAVRFARVVRTAPRAAAETGPESGAIVVELGAARITVAPGFDREMLAAVVDALSMAGAR